MRTFGKAATSDGSPAASLVGGFLVGLLTGVDFTTTFNLTSLVVATLGGMLVLSLYRLMSSRI